MGSFALVAVCFGIVAAVLIICACASNSTAPTLVETVNHGNFRKSCSSGKCASSKSTTCSSTNKKTFPTMKKGSKFVIEGRTAEKISDTMYQFTDTLEQAYWLARDLYYYQMIFEPTHAYEVVDSGGKTESYSTPENTYVAPVVVPVPVHVPAYEAPAPAPSYSSPSHSSHSDSNSSHS